MTGEQRDHIKYGMAREDYKHALRYARRLGIKLYGQGWEDMGKSDRNLVLMISGAREKKKKMEALRQACKRWVSPAKRTCRNCKYGLLSFEINPCYSCKSIFLLWEPNP